MDAIDTESAIGRQLASGRTVDGIEISQVLKRYGNVEVLKDVSLTIDPGQFVTLLGPSGSGKSTLLMCLAGFEQVDAGTISVNGELVNDVPAERRNFGIVFQGYALFPHLTVAENIAFPLNIRGVGRAERDRRVAAALQLVRLDGLADRMPRQISGGQQQRVALARAIVFEPRVLLLDEPLSALDRGLRGEMQEELKRLHQEIGLSFVYVTHDQEEALFLSDQVAILNHGRIQQIGDPATLYARPVNRFVAGFLGRSNLVEVSGRIERGLFQAERGGPSFTTPLVLPVSGRRDGPADLVLCHRPERASLAEPGSAATCGTLAFEASVGNVAYHGTTFEITVQDANGGSFAISMLNSGRIPRSGERVQVRLEEDSLVPLEDASAPAGGQPLT